MKQRVVITGLGAVSAFGVGTNAFWQGLLNNESMIKDISPVWDEIEKCRSRLYSPLPNIDFSLHGLTAREASYCAPVSLQALASAKEALTDAKLPMDRAGSTFKYAIHNIDPNRLGVYVGSSMGGVSTGVQYQLNFIGNAIRQGQDIDSAESVLQKLGAKSRYDRFLVPKQMSNSPAASIGIAFGAQRYVQSFSSACATGATSIGAAFNAVSRGEVDVAITGASEYSTDPIGAVFHSFDVTHTLTQSPTLETYRGPFDKNRSGMVFSEGGCGMLILEQLEAAEARGADIYAEVIGYDESFDAYNIVSPEPDGKAVDMLIRNLLESAQLNAEQVDYINAHGTGTVANDAIEAGVINSLFSSDVLINSTKSYIGHSLGASAALESVACALSVDKGAIYASGHVDTPILDNIAMVNTFKPVNLALNLSCAFGGHNAGLLFKRYDA